MKRSIRTGRHSRRGSALLISLIAIVAMSGIAGAILASSLATKQELGGAVAHTRALYTAEAGVSAALSQLTARGAANLGSAGNPIAFGDGSYWGTAVDNGDGTWTVTSVGRSGGEQRAVQAVLNGPSGGVFNNAVFAGNSSNSGTYDMRFSGTGSSADQIRGDIYSGHAATFTGDARIDGIPRAFTSVSTTANSILPDASGHARVSESGETQPIPDIAGMNYATTADIDVRAEFASATYARSTQGGRAWKLPASNPAHIFTRNPDDRSANWLLTAKDDYFLEDPTQPLRTDPNQDGSDCDIVQLTLDGSDDAPGPRDGNDKVYYIDGNLWIHNLSSYSFKIQHHGDNPVRLTLVVRGNIYMSDNLYYDDPQNDGLALIAIRDESVTDSGNIYFGDPTFGTLNSMNGFMYAENNFFDTNLAADGSARVALYGNMTAGNHVAINRDSRGHHSRLTVDLDTRIANATLELPGLPGVNGRGPVGYTVAMMREIPIP